MSLDVICDKGIGAVTLYTICNSTEDLRNLQPCVDAPEGTRVVLALDSYAYEPLRHVTGVAPVAPWP